MYVNLGQLTKITMNNDEETGYHEYKFHMAREFETLSRPMGMRRMMIPPGSTITSLNPDIKVETIHNCNDLCSFSHDVQFVQTNKKNLDI